MQKISNDLALKPITLSDQTVLLDLMHRIYTPVYQHLWFDGGVDYINQIYALDNLQKELENPDSRYYLVYYNQEVVGILRVILNQNLSGTPDKSMVKLQRIYLDSSVQGKGVGRQLMQWAENQFCENDDKDLWLEVMDTQKQAIQFYEKLGFVIAGHMHFESDLMLEKYRGMYKMIKSRNDN